MCYNENKITGSREGASVQDEQQRSVYYGFIISLGEAGKKYPLSLVL